MKYSDGDRFRIGNEVVEVVESKALVLPHEKDESEKEDPLYDVRVIERGEESAAAQDKPYLDVTAYTESDLDSVVHLTADEDDTDE